RAGPGPAHRGGSAGGPQSQRRGRTTGPAQRCRTRRHTHRLRLRGGVRGDGELMTRAPEDHPELLSVDLTTLDVVHRAAAPPPVNTKITAERQDVAAGGPAATAAVVAQALGVPATLVTAVGHSPVAAAARADLQARGVRVLDTAPEHDLAVSAIVVSQESGQRTVTSLDSGGSDPVWPDQAGLGSPAVVLIDGHYPHLALAAAEYAREHGALVVLDAGRWREVFA